MKTRTSILAMLASGILLSSSGAALGISGLAGGPSAGNAQYSVQPEVAGEQQQGGQAKGEQPAAGGSLPTVLGETVEGEGAPGGGAGPGETGASGVAGVTAGASRDAVAQPTAQRSLDDSTLPFTGFAAIPMLLIGVALLGTGIVMRRRTLLSDPR